MKCTDRKIKITNPWSKYTTTSYYFTYIQFTRRTCNFINESHNLHMFIFLISYLNNTGVYY